MATRASSCTATNCPPWAANSWAKACTDCHINSTRRSALRSNALKIWVS
jgi:hypothetical protein